MAIASPHSWEIFSGRLLPCADHLAAPVEGLRAALERLLHEAIAKPHKIRKYMQGPGRRILSRQPPGRRARTLAQHGRADGGEEVLRRGDLAPGVAVGFQPENGVSCRGCNAGSEASEAGLSILKEFLNRRFRVQQAKRVQKKARHLVSKVPGAILATTYSRTTYRCTTIGSAAFHFRVRNGNGWCHCAGSPDSGMRIAECGKTSADSTERPPCI